MITRKTFEQIKATGGFLNPEKFDSLFDVAIERMIAEDPDLTPATETLPPLLTVRAVAKN
jgi:hypothetical protein